MLLAPLFNCVCQRVDLGADVGAQQLEGGDGCERDQRCGDGVFRQFKTSFIAKESLNHFVCSFRVWLMVEGLSPTRTCNSALARSARTLSRADSLNSVAEINHGRHTRTPLACRFDWIARNPSSLFHCSTHAVDDACRRSA